MYHGGKNSFISQTDYKTGKLQLAKLIFNAHFYGISHLQPTSLLIVVAPRAWFYFQVKTSGIFFSGAPCYAAARHGVNSQHIYPRAPVPPNVAGRNVAGPINRRARRSRQYHNLPRPFWHCSGQSWCNQDKKV